MINPRLRPPPVSHVFLPLWRAMHRRRLTPTAFYRAPRGIDHCSSLEQIPDIGSASFAQCLSILTAVELSELTESKSCPARPGAMPLHPGKFKACEPSKKWPDRLN
jgi:hypothetical protein